MIGGKIQASSKHAINRLLNGGFYRAATTITNTGSTSVTGATAITGAIPESSFDARTINGSAPTIAIDTTKPQESLLAAWYCYGIKGLIDVRAKDLTTGVPIRSIHGPTPARFTFLDDGTMVIEQPVEEFWGLLDRELTFSMVARRGSGDVTFTVEFDFGTRKVAAYGSTTRNFPVERQIRMYVTPPYDATAFIVRITATGVRDNSFYLGEALLQLGQVPQPVFTDDISSAGMPRKSCSFFAEFPAPAGYISQCVLDGRFIYLTSGDARTDGTSRTNLGGSTSHDHGGKTGGDRDRTKVEKGGQSFISRGHRHEVDAAEIDPPWTKLLLIEKL